MKFIFAVFVLLCGAAAFGQSLGEVVAAPENGAAPKPAARQVQQPEAAQSAAQPAAQPRAGEITQESFDEIFLKASRGDDAAQLMLGSIYARGVPPAAADGKLAVQWLEKSAAQNNIVAMNSLGAIYGEGKIVKRDFQKAAYWRELAAEKGTSADKFALANSYMFGYMLPVDNARAAHWLEKAAEAGNIDAIERMISVCQKRGDKPAQKNWQTRLSYAQIDAANRGDVRLMYEVYKKYASGKGGLYKSIPKAVYWLRRAAEGGHAAAIATLASFCASGKYVQRDFDRAIALYAVLAKSDPLYAERIATLYSTDSERKDLQKAAEWFDRAAEKMDSMNKIHLVWKLWRGAAAAQDIPRATRYCAEILETEKSESVLKIARAIAERMRRGEPAPDDFGALYK